MTQLGKQESARGLTFFDTCPEAFPQEPSTDSHQKSDVSEAIANDNSSAAAAGQAESLVGDKANAEDRLTEAVPEKQTADPPQTTRSAGIEVSDKVSSPSAKTDQLPERDNSKREERSLHDATEKASPQQAVAPPRIDAFDKLSNILAEEAATLKDDDAILEKRLRPDVIDVLRNHSKDQKKVGLLLKNYREVYKETGQWVKVAKEIGVVIHCSARTIFRMIDGYEASLAPSLESEDEIDRSVIDGEPLTPQDVRNWDARLAVRVFLNNVPHEKKRESLAALLSEETYQVWGEKKPFPINVSPRPSSLTIDGRKMTKSEPEAEKEMA